MKWGAGTEDIEAGAVVAVEGKAVMELLFTGEAGIIAAIPEDAAGLHDFADRLAAVALEDSGVGDAADAVTAQVRIFRLDAQDFVRDAARGPHHADVGASLPVAVNRAAVQLPDMVEAAVAVAGEPADRERMPVAPVKAAQDFPVGRDPEGRNHVRADPVGVPRRVIPPLQKHLSGKGNPSPRTEARAAPRRQSRQARR